MTIDYQEEEILHQEKWNLSGKPFIGYINPYGQLIDYTQIIGERGHDEWRNPASPIFLSFISFVVYGAKIKRYEEAEWDPKKELFHQNRYEGFEDVVKRGLEYYNDVNFHTYEEFLNRLNCQIKDTEESKRLHLKYSKSFYDINEWRQLEFDLTNFFKQCYSDRDFFKSFGRVPLVHDRITFCKKYHLKDVLSQDEAYYEYCLIQLMSYFKDIMVQYLGYDSIERSIPENDLVQINNSSEASNGYTFSPIPRTITTSCINPNERFYNWLLMDWNIQRIPKMIWNEDEKRYTEEPPLFKYYQTEKEEILGKEIASIKKEVPKQYRKEYFRK